jgi:3-deoxy-D-manno-octulosonic-acid transferase
MRFEKISNKNSIIISGDTRFDRVKTFMEKSQLKSKNILKKQKGFTYLVAGSTYKICEKNLISTLKRLNEKNKSVKLVLVPHEINSGNIRRLNKLIKSGGYNPVNYTIASHPISLKDNDILIIDVIGILAHLYKEADIVFIGGSYKGSVHSVLEPAVFGKAVLSGPYIRNSCEAVKLQEIGGLKVCENKEELYNEILILSKNISYRKKVVQTAKLFFKNNTGAAKFIIKDIEKILK